MLQEAVVHVNNVANVPFGTTVVNDWLYWNDFKFKSLWTWRLFKKQCERYGIKLFTSIIIHEIVQSAIDLSYTTHYILKNPCIFFLIRWSCKQLFKKQSQHLICYIKKQTKDQEWFVNRDRSSFFFNFTYNSTIQACSKSLSHCHCYQTVTSDIQLHRH